MWDCDDEQYQSVSVIMSNALPEKQPLYESEVALIYEVAPPPSEWLRGLMMSINRATGVTPTLTSLATIDAKDKVCIILSGIHGPPQNIDGSNFEAIKSLLVSSKGVLWVTSGSALDSPVPENALHTGLLRTRRVEDASRRFVSLDLDPARQGWDAASHAIIARVFAATFDYSLGAGSVDFEFAERDGRIFVPRVRPDVGENAAFLNAPKDAEMQPFVQPGRELKMEVQVPGLLDSIVFTDDEDAGQPLPAGWVEVEPRAFGLNFRDVMHAMGQLDEKQDLGVECSGVVTRLGSAISKDELRVGDRVAALIVYGHIVNRVRIPRTSVVPIPDGMTFSEAASFGMVFATAYYSLFEAARLDHGETVLIHAASGGVGQACLILAQWKGLEVFATVGTPAKREFLTKTNGIPDERIFSSRDGSFAPAVLDATGQRGVDAVINSLAGELLHDSWGILAPHGRFVEIGKKDIHQNMSLEMAAFRKAVSFMAVDIVQLCDYKGKVIQRILVEVMRLLDKKVINNIQPVIEYSLEDTSRALCVMQAGKHIGKIVVVPKTGSAIKVGYLVIALKRTANSVAS